jgi:3-phosphoshikimate 1-carboxyvinyltransferase
MTLEIQPVSTINGTFRPPSDKSLTHRAYLLASIADGESRVSSPLRGEDCEATLRCLNQLGLRHEWHGAEIRLIPTGEWREPTQPLDCGNSGTTMRLLSGLVASRPLDCTLVGDPSLSSRPMSRIAKPLMQMGATVEGDTPPLHVVGGCLKGIAWNSKVASAQVKSCILLAGLRAEGVTSVSEPTMSRDHTERLLDACGVELSYGALTEGAGYSASVRGGQAPHSFEFSVPADISSASFFLVAAAMLPKGSVMATDLSMNPGRTGILQVFRQCGIPTQPSEDHMELGEPIADLRLGAPAGLRPFAIGPELVPSLVDEIPILAVLATQCEGVTEIRGAGELRVKECDRIEAMANGLRSMGAHVETYEDGLSISGPTRLRGAAVEAQGDHRIAMSFAIAGLVADAPTTIHGAESIATSYPDFERDLMRLCIV